MNSTDTENMPQPTSAANGRTKARRAASVLGLVAAAALALWLLGRPNPPHSVPTSPSKAAEADPTTPAVAADHTWTDAEIRAGLLGDWERTADYSHVLLTLREDGTGGMVIRLAGLNRTLVGERIDVDIVWQVNDGQVVFESLRGRPAAAYAMVRAIKGDRRERDVLELTERRVVFDDRADHEREYWTRPTAD